jgi:predicted nucleic acid-binding protein
MLRKHKAGYDMRVFVDSSTLIALARIGNLDMLRTVLNEIFITTDIKQEIIKETSPDAEAFKEAINNWIIVVDYRGKPAELRKYGLDSGEASLFLAAKPHDRLILDEANARRFAESKGLKFTGLIGLIVAAVRTRKLTGEERMEIMNKLAAGDFRVSTELYLWAREKIERC